MGIIPTSQDSWKEQTWITWLNPEEGPDKRWVSALSPNSPYAVLDIKDFASQNLRNHNTTIPKGYWANLACGMGKLNKSRWDVGDSWEPSWNREVAILKVAWWTQTQGSKWQKWEQDTGCGSNVIVLKLLERFWWGKKGETVLMECLLWASTLLPVPH